MTTGESEAIKQAVETATAPLLARIEALEAREGLSVEDFHVEYNGERTLTLIFARGDLRKSATIVLPLTIYRGVFDDERAYQRGDSVTWGGSCWIAHTDTREKPGASSAWQLAVKKGRDGREGIRGPAGPAGPRGPQGGWSQMFRGNRV